MVEHKPQVHHGVEAICQIRYLQTPMTQPITRLPMKVLWPHKTHVQVVTKAYLHSCRPWVPGYNRDGQVGIPQKEQHRAGDGHFLGLEQHQGVVPAPSWKKNSGTMTVPQQSIRTCATRALDDCTTQESALHLQDN